MFGDGAQGDLLAGGDGLEWVPEAATAPQLDFDEDERLSSNMQIRTTPELMFRTLLTKDGAKRLELVRT